ncbi:hypothetical protein KA531_03645 [Candidatus Saccharibacteria bacterium]|nr:hypothetical protein [Candidatus Saccharibacteria bacterium]
MSARLAGVFLAATVVVGCSGTGRGSTVEPCEDDGTTIEATYNNGDPNYRKDTDPAVLANFGAQLPYGGRVDEGPSDSLDQIGEVVCIDGKGEGGKVVLTVQGAQLQERYIRNSGTTTRATE